MGVPFDDDGDEVGGGGGGFCCCDEEEESEIQQAYELAAWLRAEDSLR